MFGVDESFLQLHVEGVSFEKLNISLERAKIAQILDIKAANVEKQFQDAVVNNTGDIIILHFRWCRVVSKDQDVSEVASDERISKVLKLIHCCQLIRLTTESCVYFNSLQCCTQYLGIKIKKESDAVFFLPPSMISRKNISPLHIESANARLLQSVLKQIDMDSFTEHEQSIMDFYDLSYFQMPSLALTTLIVGFEMLLLEDENAKKEKLSKRCAVYLFEEKDKRIKCYKEVRRFYEMRCAFVHEGRGNVEYDDILKLRTLLRECIMKQHTEHQNKQELISTIKCVVCKLDTGYWKD